jgi:cytochrome b
MTTAEKVRAWDLAVRVFHWSLVIAFAIAYVSGDTESVLHTYSGYAVLGLVGFRVAWGFVGTKHARFSDFIFGPVTVWRYARSLLGPRPVRYLGHNPLGGWMVLALLLALFVACWSGLEAYGAKGHGPLAGASVTIVGATLANGDEREHEQEKNGKTEGDELWEELHEGLSNFTLALVALHILGVLLSSAVHRENLVRAMVTGDKALKNLVSDTRPR